MRKTLLMALCAALLLIGPGLSRPALANSAQTWWSGTDGAGLIVTEGECPIEVTRERLTFELWEFPENFYDVGEEEAFLAYSGMVSAEYTFLNPTDLTVDVRLAFPFGQQPHYSPFWSGEADDAEKYGVSVDGQEIERRIRHTYRADYADFYLEEDLPRLSDGYLEDDFFLPGMTVTRYAFRADGVDSRYPAANAAFDFVPSPDVRILFPQLNGGSALGGDRFRAEAWVENGDTFEVYAIGGDFFPEWTFYRDGACRDGEEIAGMMSLTEVETLTFEELALSSFDPEGDVSAIDWYNAFVCLLNDNHWQGGLLGTDRLSASDLLRWYEYELTFAPGQTLVNRVEAPIYPDIDTDCTPSLYTYTYLLSPAGTWADFGELEIVLNTPFYLIDDDSFEKTEGGYRKILPGLPEGELVFSLATEPAVTRPASFFGCRLSLSPAGPALLGLFALAPALILRRRA